MKGLIEEEMGKLEAASISYDSLLKLDPNQINARGRLANILVLLGKPADSIQHYKQLQSSNLRGQQSNLNQALGVG
jgi:DNA-binding SARP family transcriptional activator